MPRTLLLLPATAVLLLAACGDDRDATAATNGSGGGAPTRTIEIEMVDIAFDPQAVEVEVGETVRFRFTNAGEVAHDAFIGDAGAQADHEVEMREGGEHGGGHGDEDTDALTVEPGETGELTHTFTEAGTVEIGCHQPGHYDAGMKVRVEVT